VGEDTRALFPSFAAFAVAVVARSAVSSRTGEISSFPPAPVRDIYALINRLID